jgi:hypothetical protein
MSAAIRRRPRTRRVLKWVATVICLLLLGLNVLSLRWSVRWVRGEQVQSGWTEPLLYKARLLVVHSSDADECPCVSEMVTLQSGRISVFWDYDPSVDGLRLVARPGWSVQRLPHQRAWSEARAKWWKWIEWFDWIASPSYRTLTIRLWPPVLAVAAVTMLLWWLDRRRIPAGHCQNCGYDLTGNVSRRCPECGTPVKREGKPA